VVVVVVVTRPVQGGRGSGGDMAVVICTGNPRVFLARPVPVPMKNLYPHHG